MTVVELTPCNWAVLDSDGVLVRDGFPNNAAAWSWADRFSRRPLWTSGRRERGVLTLSTDAA